jgi:hypothetical protein
LVFKAFCRSCRAPFIPYRHDRVGFLACDRRCRRWADTAPTGVASGRTGVSAIAVIPLRAQTSPHHRKLRRAFRSVARDTVLLSAASGHLMTGISLEQPDTPKEGPDGRSWGRQIDPRSENRPEDRSREATRRAERLTHTPPLPSLYSTLPVPLCLRNFEGGIASDAGTSGSSQAKGRAARPQPRPGRVVGSV